MKTKYNITPDNIGDYMRSREFDSVLKIDDKAGLDYKDDELRAAPYNPHIHEKKSKTRCVKLEITSFRGISCGAIHYYGKMIADGVTFQYIDNPSITTTNWKAVKVSPFYQWTYDFELWRPVTQKELDEDPERWRGYHPGSFTTGFEIKQEIIELAKECFKMRFVGEWELWVVDNTTVKGSVYQIEL